MKAIKYNYYIKDKEKRLLTDAQAERYKAKWGDVIWKQKKALIIIDMWDNYLPGHKRFEGLIEQMSLKLYKFILSANVPVILASHDTSKVEGKWQDTGLPWKAPNDTLLEGTNAYKDGIVSWDKDEVMTFLRSHEVTDVYFTGVSYPGCVEARPIGLNNMKKRFNCHVVADCVLNTAGTGYTDFDILHETYVYLLKSGESHSFLSNVRN